MSEFLRAPRNPAEAAIHAKLIERAAKLTEEIRQIFDTCASWNENARKPGEAPIDPDPDGELARMLEYLQKFKNEAV